MANETYSHGRRFTFEVSADNMVTWQDLTPYLTSYTESESTAQADVTTAPDGDMEYLPGMTDGTASAEGLFDPRLDRVISDTIDRETLLHYRYRPTGEGSGRPQIVGQTIVSSYGVSAPVGDRVSVSLSFEGSDGDYTRSTQ